jgi:hypothetical protein
MHKLMELEKYDSENNENFEDNDDILSGSLRFLSHLWSLKVPIHSFLCVKLITLRKIRL